jgi:integrase
MAVLIDEETVAEFVTRWLRDFPRPKPSTNSHNRRMVRPLVAAFGEYKLSEVNRRMTRVWALEHHGNVPVARALWNDAIDDEATEGKNPFAGLRLPRSKGRSGLVVPSEGEIRALADAALPLFGVYGKTIRATVLFAAYVGCRPGEMFALEWADLDFEAGEVRISKTIGPKGTVTLPKNGHERTVVLLEQAKDALWSDCGLGPYGDEGGELRPTGRYVFETKQGKRFARTSHFHYWSRVREAAGRPQMQFYELRHFAATNMLERGLSPGDVAIQLGHTDGGALVQSTYGHPSDVAARARVREAMAR